jgi:hypothetical protein
LATKDHFSSNWASRVRGGNLDQLVVEVEGVLASDPAQSADGAAIHLAEPASLADAASLGDVLQDRFGLLGRESRVEEGGPLPLGEAGLADPAAKHASRILRAVVTGHGQISGPPLALFGAVGIQAAEASEVVHVLGLPVRSSKRKVIDVVRM